MLLNIPLFKEVCNSSQVLHNFKRFGQPLAICLFIPETSNNLNIDTQYAPYQVSCLDGSFFFNNSIHSMTETCSSLF
uniref:Ovule protein n=1 Tax=Romanomermis culicivorax TaxID=13658 RepID=A0A915JEF6_ROMCU